MFCTRLKEEEKLKRERIYCGLTNIGVDIKPLVTRFFPSKLHFEQTYFGISQPTLFIPFGKRLGTLGQRYQTKPTPQEYLNHHYAQATLAAALTSIPAQLLYDVFWAVVYSLIAAPSLIIGVIVGIHAGFTGNRDSKYIAQTVLGNVICAPYFALAIAVDLCREVLALVTRTYATIMESPQARVQAYWATDDAQFSNDPAFNAANP